MVRTSNIREKLRSNALKELARERGNKRARFEEKDEHDDIEELKPDRERTKPTHTSNSLLSILPKPKNSSAFGPTVKLDQLLKLPERANEAMFAAEDSGELPERVAEDGLVEVDLSRVISDVSSSLVRDLTVEKAKPIGVVVPRGKEKQKNQITYLAQLGKASELEHKEQVSQGRMNKAAARSKYGW